MSGLLTAEDHALARDVQVSNHHLLAGELYVPEHARGIVLFAHGSGSSRHSPRNQFVARMIQKIGIATLLFDLLTPEEDEVDLRTREFRFDIELLAGRLVNATRWVGDVRDWISSQIFVRHLRVGYFGASTGAAAALVAASYLGKEVGAVVSRGGRPDLAGPALPLVKSPTLLIVGGLDESVTRLNGEAYRRLACTKDLQIVPGTSHLFEEPGALAAVARAAGLWFQRYLQPPR